MRGLKIISIFFLVISAATFALGQGVNDGFVSSVALADTLQPEAITPDTAHRVESVPTAEKKDVAAMPLQPLRLPYSAPDIAEYVVMDHGKRAIRIVGDTVRYSHPEAVVDKKNCMIVMSKKDYYLYVYERVGRDTLLRARYDCAFALRKGHKTRQGDMKTPHATAAKRWFSISQICPAHFWRHDFRDGRGSILAYGAWFLRLNTGTSNRSIGIHGSTNNEKSVPGRASEGCIRLHDEDIKELRANYAFVGMPVLIKDEQTDDLPFEVKALSGPGAPPRLRHLDPAATLSNEQVAKAPLAKW